MVGAGNGPDFLGAGEGREDLPGLLGRDHVVALGDHDERRELQAGGAGQGVETGAEELLQRDQRDDGAGHRRDRTERALRG